MIDKVIQSTTQQFLDIYDITNDLVIMKDGTTSLIITVDAMNFGLLAEEEQDGIMYAYASLLNSLNYPIQIIIRSQTKDVTGYLLLLREQEEITQNKLMRQRIRAYREFVSNLIHERNVLDKKFYVCIPASSIELGLLAPASVMPGSKPFDVSTIEKSVILEKARNILEAKRDHLISQFARIGLFSRQLTTQEIIQLFYLSYNPEAAEGQQLADTSNYTTPLVTAGIEGTPMNTLPNQPGNPTPPQGASPMQSITPPPAEVVIEPTTPIAAPPTAAAYQPTQMPNKPQEVAAATPQTSTPPPPVPTPEAVAANQTPVALVELETPAAVESSTTPTISSPSVQTPNNQPTDQPLPPPSTDPAVVPTPASSQTPDPAVSAAPAQTLPEI